MTLSIRAVIGIVLAALLVLAGVAVASAIYGPRLFKEQQKVETRDDKIEAVDQEAKADERLASKAEDLRITVDQGQAQVIYLKEQAHAEQDDDGPLPVGRLERLRNHDAALCAASPESCGGGQGAEGQPAGNR